MSTQPTTTGTPRAVMSQSVVSVRADVASVANSRMSLGSRSGGRVLVVDDSETNRKLIEAILEHADCEVRTAENGQDAIALADAERFDLIIMDMQMPVMDGYTATRRLRERGCQTPVVALTADAMTGASQQCLAAGCTAFLSKPIEIPELRRHIAHYASGRRGNPASPSSERAESRAPQRQFLDIPLAEMGPILCSLSGEDAEELAEIVAEFVAELRVRVSSIHATVVAGDWTGTAHLAHALRGTAGTIGFMPIAEASERVEAAALDGHRDLIRLMRAVCELHDLVCRVQAR